MPRVQSDEEENGASMTSGHRLLKNTVYQSVMRILADVIYFAFYVALSRRFGAEGIGVYSFSLAIGMAFFVAADYGLSFYMAQEGSRNRAALPKILGSLIWMKLAFSLVAIVLIISLVPIFRIGKEGLLPLALIASSQVLYRFGEIFKSTFAIHEELSRISFLEIVFKGGICLFGMLFLVMNLPFDGVLLAFPVSAGIYLFFLYWKMVHSYGHPSFKPDFSEIRKAFKKSFPFFLTMILTPLYFRLNPILLQYFKGFEACGIYAAPYKLAEALLSFALYYRIALFPTLSRFYKESREGHQALYQNSFKYGLLVFLPLAILLFLTADKIILTIFGPEFANSSSVFRLMSVYLLFAMMRHVLIATLGSIDAQWKWVLSQVVGLLVGLVSGLVLIPRFSAFGAAVSLLVAELFVFVLAFSLASQKLGFVNFPVLVPKPLFASLVAAGLTVIFLKYVPVFIILPIAFLICAVFLYLTGAITKGEVKYFKEALLKTRLEEVEP